MRAFISIPVSESIKQHANDIINNLKMFSSDIKWVEYDNLHITVKFLGEVDEDVIKDIRRNLSLVGENCPIFKLVINDIAFFPNKIRPKIVYLGILGELQKAAFLSDRVDAYLHDLNFEIEKNRNYHLTLGRIRTEKNIAQFMTRCGEINSKIQKNSFIVNEINLMESKLTKQGPQYSILGRFPLLG